MSLSSVFCNKCQNVINVLVVKQKRLHTLFYEFILLTHSIHPPLNPTVLGLHSCVAVAFSLCYLSALRVDVTTLCRAIMVKYNIVPTLPSSLSRSLRVVTPGEPDRWDSVDWVEAACLDYSRAKICQSVHGISDSDSPVSSLQCDL